MDADDVERGYESTDGKRNELQAVTNRRYDRSSRIYDLYDRPMDILGGVGRRRRRLLSRARGKVLEVGVGTGRNLDLYADDIDLTGIDSSGGMLERARSRAADLGMTEKVSLDLADVQDLPYPNASFDTATATCVFCSVADPVRGLEDNPDVPIVNVHIPYEGHIEGTDAFVAFDEIADWDGLSEDLSAPLVLYCRSGNMSAQAADALKAMGYKNVVDLEGGMKAWTAAGFELLTEEPPSAD